MLHRQRMLLALLSEAKRTLVRPVVGYLAFLHRQEAATRVDAAGYDFVPFPKGPRSFTLERDLDALITAGYLTGDGGRLKLALERLSESRRLIGRLPSDARTAVEFVARHYGRMSRDALCDEIGARYPRYFSDKERIPAHRDANNSDARSQTAVYTAGYERCSVDLLFGRLVAEGIQAIADVRGQSSSGRFGFRHGFMASIAAQLGLAYRGFPGLGIPSRAKVGLDGFASYRRLLDSYERDVLPRRQSDLAELAALARRESTVLLCKEQDVRCCHRSRLAEAVSRISGLQVRHLKPVD